MLNGKPVSTKDFITNGDEITLEPGKDGKDASATIRELIGEIVPVNVTINGIKHTIEPRIERNGIQAELETVVQDRDQINYSHSTQLMDALTDLGIETFGSFEIYVNDKSMALENVIPQFFIGNMPISLNHQLKDGDEVRLGMKSSPTVGDVVSSLGKSIQPTMSITFNGEPVSMADNRSSLLLNGQKADSSTIVQPGDRLTIPETVQRSFLFSDIFLFIDYTLPKTTSTSYQLLRNGEPIGFNDPIFSGDSLEIKFDS